MLFDPSFVTAGRSLIVSQIVLCPVILLLSVINKSPVQDQTHPNDHFPPTYEMTPGLYILLVFIQWKPPSERGFEPVQGNYYFDMFFSSWYGVLLITYFFGKLFHFILERKILFPLKMY